MTDSRICECGQTSIYFRTEDAGKLMKCESCGREYTIFLEVDDNDERLQSLFAEPNQQMLFS